VAAGTFAAIFILQAASELIRNDALSYFALQVLGSWPERVLITLLVFWLVAVSLSASRGNTRILGFAVMAVVVGVDAYNYVLLYLGEGLAFEVLYLLPFVWLLFESRKREPKKDS
jgi:Ni/Fe-hydrogenase subunit HybB-like protein